QLYNLEGESYTVLLCWLALILPAVLNSKSRLPNAIWFAGVVTAVLIWIFEMPASLLFGFYRGTLSEDVRILCAMSLPYFFLGIGYGAAKFLPEQFCTAARFWSYVTLLI